MNRKPLLLLIILLVLGGASTARAQCTMENTAFKSGEHLSYDLYFNWRFIWTKAGTASLWTDSIDYEGQSAYKVQMISKSGSKADVFFKMRDTLTSVISKDMLPLYFRKGAEEGKRYSIDKATYFYDPDSVRIKLERTYPRKNRYHCDTVAVSGCVQDMLSILMRYRSYTPDKFKMGEPYNFDMADGRRVKQETLIFRGYRLFEDKNEVTYRCLVFSFVEYKKGKEKEVITFYVTDDDNHLPVRLDMFLNFGSAKAFLKMYNGNRHPMTSIVKDKKAEKKRLKLLNRKLKDEAKALAAEKKRIEAALQDSIAKLDSLSN